MNFFLFTLLSFFLFLETSAQVQTGKASFYSKKFEGRMMANGEIYHNKQALAAHRFLPFGTKLKVTNLANNKTAIVKVTDRGPFVKGRIVDVSKSVAKKLDFLDNGVTDVVIEVIEHKEEEDQRTTASQALEKPKKDKILKPTKVKSEPETEVEENRDSIIETDFYETTVTRIKPKGYGVQIGSYEEMANLIQLTDNLQVNYEKRITVQVKNIQSVKVYSIILGKFHTRKTAENFKEKVTKKYPGSFIVDFSTLETHK